MFNDNKCNNFQTKFAYINGLSINIIDYINNYSKNDKKIKLTCNKGHELIYSNNSQFFTHKYDNYNKFNTMTEWYSEWQSNFKNTEILFLKINNTQYKDRYADVLIENHNIIIEFCHNKISSTEIEECKYDFKLNNKNIIWIIDGNDSDGKSTISVKDFTSFNKNRIVLDFNVDNWKYKNFITYDNIFIDINELIYKVSPKYVKNNMIDVNKPFNKNEFIELINNNDNIINIIDYPCQCTLYIKQQGAGNGKTYGLIKMIASQEFENYKFFIIVTKQHSAKYIIYKEFKDQINGTLEGCIITKINNIDYEYEEYENEINHNEKYKTNNIEYKYEESDNNHYKKYKINETKKYTIEYINKSKSNCQIVIATIDSLLYTLGNKHNNTLNKFDGLVNSIIDGYIDESKKTNSINYGGINIKLNKDVCLICDETQDLTEDYGQAIIRIMEDRYINAYIVGDKLQSLITEKNAFTYLMDTYFNIPIYKHKFPNENICRRFYHKNLVDFVNCVVSFKNDNYNLPNITPYKNEIKQNKRMVKIIKGRTIYANNDDINDSKKLNHEVEKIIKYYDKEVINNNYKPEDFLIITPFTKKNPLVNVIETAINIYWNKKYKNNNFKRYAIFHKSEEGTSLNLLESEKATRIVSIHTSKGDGRNVVFIIGLDEQSLKKYSKDTNNLIYNSFIHVAFTRMKEKLYIRCIYNNDDIHQRILKYKEYIDNENYSDSDTDSDTDTDSTTNKELNILTSKKIDYKEILKNIKNQDDFKILHDNIISKTNNKLLINQDNEKHIIDMGHHNIRYPSMLIFLYIKIINHELKNKNDNIKKQIIAIMRQVEKSDIRITKNWKEYYNYISRKEIAILKLSTGYDYNNYFNIICKFMNCIQNKLKNIFEDKVNIMLCPMESIILYFMMQIIRSGIKIDISINELYNIINIYSKAFNNNIKGHEECLCKKYFIDNNNDLNNQMNKYLLNHYEDISNIGKIYDTFLSNYPNLNWLIDHPVYLNGDTNDFIIYNTFNLIAYDNENVFILYFKPQLNGLNYNEILIDSIFDMHLINNVKKPAKHLKEIETEQPILENFNKFNNKNIKTFIFTLNKNDYMIIDWNFNTENLISKNKDLITQKIKEKIYIYYFSQSNIIHNFYKNIKTQIINEKLSIDLLIQNIIESFDNNNIKNKRNYPKFITSTLLKIQDYIYDCSNEHEKEIMINKYDNAVNFIRELEKYITRSINRYFS